MRQGIDVIRSSQGFTLAEVLVALSLSLLIVGAMYTLYITQTKTQVLQRDLIELQQNVRASLDLINRELRQAGYDPGGVNQDDDPGNDFIALTLDPSRLMIQSDLNGNGTVTDSNEKIVYWHDLQTATLRRNTGGGNQPLAEHIEKFEMQYLDAKGELAKTSEEIHGIKILIQGKTAHADPLYPLNNGFRTLTLVSLVNLRNLSLSQ